MLNKIILILSIFLILSLVIFLNFGKFIDVTQKPQKADIIVALGGDESGCRLKTALSLYQDGISKSGKFIYTGENSFSPAMSRKEYLISNGIKPKDIVHVDETIIFNTMEEVFFIKMYMLKHHLKSVVFVSHPQHSRRISALADNVADYKGSGLEFMVASCHPVWWDRDHYYRNGVALIVTTYEAGKLLYNLIKYGTPLIGQTQYSKKISNGEWEKALERLDYEGKEEPKPDPTGFPASAPVH